MPDRRLSAITDIPRVGGPAQDAYRSQVDRYLAHLQSLLGDEEDDDTRRKATVTLSAMIGALMIARALGPTTRSDEILRDVRDTDLVTVENVARVNAAGVTEKLLQELES